MLCESPSFCVLWSWPDGEFILLTLGACYRLLLINIHAVNDSQFPAWIFLLGGKKSSHVFFSHQVILQLFLVFTVLIFTTVSHLLSYAMAVTQASWTLVKRK